MTNKLTVSARTKIYKRNKTYLTTVSGLSKKTWSTRLDEEAEEEIKSLVKKSGLKEAEVLRRLIIMGLKQVKEPADLMKI